MSAWRRLTRFSRPVIKARQVCAIAAFLCCTPVMARAADVPAPQTAMPARFFLRELEAVLANADKAKGRNIDPALFKDFWLKWELVTTRYKPDGQELRFIYVNPIGAEALAKGLYPFPEGTVFAKIGAHAEHDPLFDTSLVPGAIARAQIMLKNPQDPQAIDGWVYDLYATPPFEERLTHVESESCAACHAIAKPRDFIFALPFPTMLGVTSTPLELAPFRDKFHATPVEKLPADARQAIATDSPQAKSAMQLVMPTFAGTLFEARELLANFARTSRLPYVLNSPDEKKILIAIPKDKCVRIGSMDKPLEMQYWNVCD